MKPFSGLKIPLTSGVLLIALATLFTGGAFAQTTGAGTITGSISDPSGSAVPGAKVDILNTDTGVARSITTNEAGNYVAQFLQPGPYQVSVLKDGFAKLVRKDLSLQVGQILSVDLALTLRTTTDTITVEGASSVVDSEKTDVSQTISQNQKDSLPVSGRRWDTFVLMTPNVTTDGTSGLVSYRGISGIYNGNTVDGANNNQALFSEARGRALSGAYVYSLDSIQEYQVSASNYSAELGQAAGGIVNAVTKSGGNVVHGDLFYYLRYPTWNALDPLPKSQGNYTQPIHQWQQFGASVGGPAIKDKLFYFFTYDGSRKVNPITYTSTTYNASTKALPCPVQVTGAQCAAANAFLDGLVGTYPRATDQDVLFGKIDYQVNSKNHVSSSFDWMDYNAPNAYSTAPSYNNSSIYTNGSYAFHERIFVTNWDTILSNSLVNNARFQWGRDLEVAGSNAPAPYVSLSNIAAFGEFYALPRTAEPDEHRIQFSDTISKVYGRHTMKFGIDVNVIHEVMINLFNGTGQYSYTGTAQTAFNNWIVDSYGINLGDGLTGKHYNSFVQVTDPVTHVGKDDFYNNDYAGFFEDSWKATPKLTINMGIRYDLFHIPAPPQPNTLTPLTTLYTSTINVPKDQLGPRLGLAWNFAPNTVLRGGYGIFYAKTTNSTYYATRVENGVIQQTFNCSPSPSSAAYCPALTYPNVIFSTPGPALAAPFSGALTPQVTTFTPPSASQSTRGQAPDWVNPRVHEAELTLEHQLPGGIGISLGYLLSRGLHLPIFTDTNLAPATTTKSYDILSATGGTNQVYTVPYYTTRLNTNTGQVFVGFSDVNSWYNSMVITVRHPMSHGLEFTMNYTLSKSTDGAQVTGSNGTFNGSDVVLDPYNKKGEYGLSDLDQRQRFVANAAWAPVMQGINNHTTKYIVNGWTLATIFTASTGQPITPFISGTPSPLDGGLTAGEASNASASAGRAGWLPRNAFTGPGFADVDFRLGRQFAIRERIKLALIGEAFNLFNHTNISSVNTTAFTYSAPTPAIPNGTGPCAGHTNACLVPSPSFMAPTATSNLLWGPRQLQVSARIIF